MGKPLPDTIQAEIDRRIEAKSVVKRISIFQEAEGIIYGQREKDYGHPSVNIRRIMLLWNAHIAAKYGDDAVKLDMNDVPTMLRYLKEARLINDPKHHDTMVDVCGYMGVQARVNESETV